MHDSTRASPTQRSGRSLTPWDTGVSHQFAYERVNKAFASRVAEIAQPNATVWVHDYQLQLVPSMLREMRPDLSIGFFLHIPFPPSALFAQLPWRRQILEGLLGADLIGFHTHDDARQFVYSCERSLGIAAYEGTIASTIGASASAPFRSVSTPRFLGNCSGASRPRARPTVACGDGFAGDGSARC